MKYGIVVLSRTFGGRSFYSEYDGVYSAVG